MGGARGRHPGHDLRAGRRADGEGRRRARVRRRRSSSQARGSTRRSPRRGAIERETGATFVHAFEDPRVIAGQGTLGLELAEQLPAGPGDGRHPGRRRRAGVGHRDRAPRAAAGAAARRRAGGGVRAARRARADGRDDRRRDRRQASRRAHVRDRRRARWTSSSSSTTRRSRRRSCSCSSARSSSSRAPAQRRSRRSSQVACPARDSACAVLAGGNIDATTLNSVIRHGLTSRAATWSSRC